MARGPLLFMGVNSSKNSRCFLRWLVHRDVWKLRPVRAETSVGSQRGQTTEAYAEVFSIGGKQVELNCNYLD
jgi:hypothetical protein